MNSYLAIRISHSLPAILLVLGLIAHLIILWRASKKDPVTLSAKLARSRKLSLPLFALLLLSLPVSGWWLTHLAGFPLGQTWLLVSIALLPLLFVLLWLLSHHLNKWQQSLTDENTNASKAPQLALLWFGLLLILLLAISGLMGAKPV